MSSTHKTLTIPPLTPDYWEQAKAELSSGDAVMAKIIADYPDGQLECRGAPFETLCRSIVGQQISVKAADSMWAKLEDYLSQWERSTRLSRVGRGHEDEGPLSKSAGRSARQISVSPDGREEIVPEAFLEASDEALRACGLSRQKIAYLRNIAEFFNEDAARLSHGHWHGQDDDDIIAQLVSIKGVGTWTAEMFLIFHVMHPDVFPVGDIGIQKAIELHYDCPIKKGWGALDKKEKPAAWTQVAEQWHPWRTVASWYLWRSLDPVPVAY